MIATSKLSGRSLPRTSSLCSQSTGRSAPLGWPPQSILRIVRLQFCDPMVPSGYSIPPDLKPHSLRAEFGGAVGVHTPCCSAAIGDVFSLEGRRRFTMPRRPPRQLAGLHIQRRGQAYDGRRTAEIRHFHPTIDILERR